ncbi:MAG TPA: hypothetical protein VHI54_10880 [Actinomycetota bacterium]|nr:hypothetical protein [Actinomycetota bacterium]
MKFARIVLVAGLAVSCAAPERARPGAPSDPESPAVSTPGQNQSPPRSGPLFVEPRTGLVDVRPHQFERVRVTGAHTLVVRFYGGIEACEGLDRVEVDYEPRRIVVTLFVGRVPTAEACIEIAVLKATRVQLDEPVAGREVVDGAPRR